MSDTKNSSTQNHTTNIIDACNQSIIKHDTKFINGKTLMKHAMNRHDTHKSFVGILINKCIMNQNSKRVA